MPIEGLTVSSPPAPAPERARRRRRGSRPRFTRPELSVLIPTRNEAENIAPLIDRLDGVLRGVSSEVIFIDDSTDGTPEAIAERARRAGPRLALIHRPRAARRDGLGGAVATGLRVARGTSLCVMDADLQHPPELIPSLLEKARHSGADIVVATRHGTDGGLGRVRSLISQASTLLARLLFPTRLRAVSDPMSGFFLIRRAAVELDSLKPHGFKILLELLVRGRRLTTCEVSYEFGVRHAGESKASLREGLRYLRHLLRLRIDGRLLRFVEFGLVGASGIAVNTAVLALLTEAVGLHYMVSAIVSTQVATVWNFVLTDRWVFKTRRLGASWLARLSAFSFMNNVALALGGPLLFLLVSGLGVQYLLANVVSLLALAIARFVAADSLIWRVSTAGAAVEEASPDAAKPGSWLLPRARRLAFAHAPDDRS